MGIRRRPDDLLTLAIWLAALGCGGGGGSLAPATATSCNHFCDTVVAARCALPVYDTAGDCKTAECKSLGAASAPCQRTTELYYDCEASQPDICADTGCNNQFAALRACMSGGGSGGGGAGNAGAGGGAGVGGAGGGLDGGLGGAGGGLDGGLGGAGGGLDGGLGGAGGGAGGGGGSSGAFTPTLLGDRLVLWLDASRETMANGARVAIWTDRSRQANHATQATPAYTPTFTAAGINGLPSVTFDGNTTFLQIADAPTLRWGTQDFVLLVVARGSSNSNANTMLYQKSNLLDPYAGPSLYLNGNKPAPSAKAAMQLDGATYALSRDGFGDDLPRLFGGRLIAAPNGGTLEVLVNGAIQGNILVSPAIDADAPGQPAIIGQNGYNPSPGFQAFRGDISEMIAVKGSLTDGEMAGLEAYLMSKYGLH